MISQTIWDRVYGRVPYEIRGFIIHPPELPPPSLLGLPIVETDTLPAVGELPVGSLRLVP